MEELTIKVPGPFAGVAALGFTAQYPRVDPFSQPRDIPLVIEGPPRPMEVLASRLRRLRDSEGPHGWSDPVQLSDEVVIMAFRDRSLAGSALADGARAQHDYVLNLVRPVAFPFLRDCALLAGLRLAEEIEIHVAVPGRSLDLHLRLDQIVDPNGSELLWAF